MPSKISRPLILNWPWAKAHANGPKYSVAKAKPVALSISQISCGAKYTSPMCYAAEYSELICYSDITIYNSTMTGAYSPSSSSSSSSES
jgi:hypothetical protein